MSRFFCLSIIIAFLISCQNYYNDTIDWMGNIPENASIDYVQKNQPHFVDIYWENPKIIENEYYYTVIPINEKNEDFMKYHLQIFFKSGKYQGYIIQ